MAFSSDPAASPEVSRALAVDTDVFHDQLDLVLGLEELVVGRHGRVTAKGRRRGWVREPFHGDDGFAGG